MAVSQHSSNLLDTIALYDAYLIISNVLLLKIKGAIIVKLFKIYKYINI